jgi:hypothetical protein
LTSVSFYKIYRTDCCGEERRLPIFASTSSSVKTSDKFCRCGKIIEFHNLVFVETIANDGGGSSLISGGVDNYEPPSNVKSGLLK